MRRRDCVRADPAVINSRDRALQPFRALRHTAIYRRIERHQIKATRQLIAAHFVPVSLAIDGFQILIADRQQFGMRYIAPFEPLENGDGHTLHRRASGIAGVIGPTALMLQYDVQALFKSAHPLGSIG